MFEGSEPLEWALEGSISEDINVLLGNDFVGRIAADAGFGMDQVEVQNALNAHDPKAGRILMLFLEGLRTGGLGANSTPRAWRPPSPSSSCASTPRSARSQMAVRARVGGSPPAHP